MRTKMAHHSRSHIQSKDQQAHWTHNRSAVDKNPTLDIESSFQVRTGLSLLHNTYNAKEDKR